ncbi:MAG TPA: SufS family cysteine desulfurase [Phycisphaerae bacterium]|nr:SufS family cysteine desulfurase [Phycisphaerae bacterium]
MIMTLQAENRMGTSSPVKLHWDVDRIRADFPILSTTVSRPSPPPTHTPRPLVYLDNAATTQKPRAVIDAIVRYYESQNANIHRGVYQLSQTATSAYEGVREKVRSFVNARESAEIIFTRGTTEGINLVASSWGRTNLRAGDEVVVSHLEHHSDIVPWQMVCEATGATLKVIPINDRGELVLEELQRFLAGGHVKIIAVNHVSNSLGTINPVGEISRMAHAAGARVLIDGAQWVAHGKTDVQALDADFYVFSGHKLIGPTGIGVLYGKRELLDAMPPYQGGGDMIASVTFPRTEYAALPNKFEAGTPDIAGVVGLGAAIDYINALGLDQIGSYEHALLTYATEKLSGVPGLKIIGTAAKKAAVVSFIMEGHSTLDIGMKLDQEGICVRTGHHCCQPVMERFQIGSTARASFAFYNTREEIDALVAALHKIAGSKSATRDFAPHAAPATVEYPKATAPSPRAAAAKLAEDFELLGERDARNEYVLDLADRLPHTFDLLKKVTPRVQGCMSQVHLLARRQPGSTDIVEFVADADADIVRGLIAVLQRIYSGQHAKDILGFNIEEFFNRIGLDGFITSQRRNGLAGMVARIRERAKEIADGK